MARTVLVAATTAGATFTVLVAGGSGSLEALPVRVVYVGMAAMALIPWLMGATVRPRWRPSSRLMPAFVAILLAYVISTMTSRNFRLSVEMLGYAVLLVLLYLLLVTLMRRGDIRAHFERLALVLCILVAGLYVLQVLILWIEWWSLVGDVAIPPLRPAYAGLTLGSPNPVATVVLVLGAFSVATTRVGGSRRMLALVVVVLVAVATFITASRGAWLGAVAGLVVAAIAGGFVSQGDTTSFRQRLRSSVGAPLLLAGAAATVVLVSLAVVSGRLTLDDGGYRVAFLKASIGMFEQSPVTGVGPGSWGVLRAANTAPSDPDLYIPHAHNLYLQGLAEFGLIGVVAFLVVTTVVGRLIVIALRSELPSRRLVGLAATFATVGFAVQQVADVLVNVPSVLLAVALPVAWLDATSPAGGAGPEGDGPSVLPSSGPPIVALVAVLAIIGGSVRIESATDLARHGIVMADGGRWSEAAAAFERATTADAALAIYRLEHGIAVANAGDLVTAEASLAGAAAADDYPYAWLNLAAVRWRLGDVDGARAALGRADRLGLQRLPISLASGWLHHQLDETEAALSAYAGAISQAPGLVRDPFWASTSAAPLGLEGVLSVVAAKAPEAMFEVNLHLGRFDDAAEVLEIQGLAEQGLYVDVLAAWRGDTSAWDSLRARARMRPLDPGIIAWCRAVAAERGDSAEVERFGKWLVALTSAESNRAVVPRIHTEGARPLPSVVLDRYGSLYRREMMSAQVVGILPQVVWENLN